MIQTFKTQQCVFRYGYFITSLAVLDVWTLWNVVTVFIFEKFIQQLRFYRYNLYIKIKVGLMKLG